MFDINELKLYDLIYNDLYSNTNVCFAQLVQSAPLYLVNVSDKLNPMDPSTSS